MRILAIETSCDETAAAVVQNGRLMLSNTVTSSVQLHQAYGGVVPEIAARSHLEVITPVIEQSLETANCCWDDIDALAVTQGPGLAGSLLIGVMTARLLALTQNKPLYAINHVEAHMYANFITETSLANYTTAAKAPTLPLLALIVSGGHSHIIYLKNHADYKVIGRTRDDAVGEAFDKVAKMLGLPYPGGPSVAKAALTGDPASVKLPSAQMSGYDFSFSGLKTAVLRAAQSKAGKDFTLPSTELPGLLDEAQKADLAASFQQTALDTLIRNLSAAIDEYKPASVIIGGGVAANQKLREVAEEKLPLKPLVPDIKLCTDNAAMIASLAYFRSKINPPTDTYKLDIQSNMHM
jgi:N6-L-threonylcarbamoyladenine synthase